MWGSRLPPPSVICCGTFARGSIPIAELQVKGDFTIASVGDITFTFDDPVEAGSLIVVGVIKWQQGTIQGEPDVMSQFGGTATLGAINTDAFIEVDDGAGLSIITELFSVRVTTGGTLSIQVSGTAASGFFTVAGAEFESQWSAAPSVDSNTGQQVAPGAIVSGTTGPASAATNALFVGVNTPVGNGPITADPVAPFTVFYSQLAAGAARGLFMSYNAPTADTEAAASNNYVPNQDTFVGCVAVYQPG